MSESELGGFIQVAPYPLEAVPYQLFAKMIGRKESTVRTMIDAAKLPTIDFVKPRFSKDACIRKLGISASI